MSSVKEMKYIFKFEHKETKIKYTFETFILEFSKNNEYLYRLTKKIYIVSPFNECMLNEYMLLAERPIDSYMSLIDVDTYYTFDDVMAIINNELLTKWIPYYEKRYAMILNEKQNIRSLRNMCLKKIVDRRCYCEYTDYSKAQDHIKQEIGHLWYTKVKKGEEEFLQKINK